MTAPAASIAELVARLQHHADMTDAFGTTQEGNDLRLAAATLIEFERLLTSSLNELDRSVTQLAKRVLA